MKLILILLFCFLTTAVAAQERLYSFYVDDAYGENYCKISNSSGTIDVMNCPGETVWRCYDDYSCEDGRTYTIFKGCAQGVQDCW